MKRATTIGLLLLTTSLSWAQDSLQVSLRAAMEAARKSSYGSQTAESRVREAQARVDESRAALLPVLGASASNVFFRSYNYAANLPPDKLESIPYRLITLHGVQDARLNAHISVFNWAAWQRYWSSKAALTPSEQERLSAGDGEAFAAGSAWLSLAKIRAVIQGENERLQIARRVDSITDQQMTSGLATQFDKIRAQGLIASSQAALEQSAGTDRSAELALQKALGLSPQLHVYLPDSLEAPQDTAWASEDSLVVQALRDRTEIQALENRLRLAQREAGSIQAEGYPSLDLSADYGASAYQFDDNHLTGTVALQATWSIWDAGRRSSRKAQQQEKIQQLQVQLQDLRASVEQEVRTSLAQMRAAVHVLATARERSRLAHQELEIAEERFRSGVAGILDVINAQNNLSLVDDAVIDARYRYNQTHLGFLKATHQLDAL